MIPVGWALVFSLVSLGLAVLVGRQEREAWHRYWGNGDLAELRRANVLVCRAGLLLFLGSLFSVAVLAEQWP